jgi:lipopolysaccharide/colanic/teichoic acid biosynthesis glycosyltransferase
MQADAPSFSQKVRADDVSITRVGRLLRASGLDELPQLWNVVRCQMSLIGPRPEQYELLAAYEPWQHERHLVKPGLTGWWQVNHRDAVPMRQNTERDLYYVRHQGPALDALILFRTAVLPFAALCNALRGRSGVADPVAPVAQTVEAPRRRQRP